MKKFLIKLGIFIFCALVFVLIILYPVGSEVYKDKKQVYINTKAPKNLDMLVLGSSRAEHSIIPSLIDSSKVIFNMGQNGYGLPSNYIMLTTLVNDAHLNIKSLLLQVDEYSFNGSKGFSRQFRDDAFYYYLKDSDIYRATEIYRGKLFAMLLRVFPQAGNLIYNDFTKFIRDYKYVFANFSASVHRSFNNAVNASASNNGYTAITELNKITPPPKETYVIEKDDAEYFYKLVNFCKTNHIRLYMYRAPILYCSTEDSRLFDEFIKNFSLKNNIPFFDYKCSYQYINFYYDHTHCGDTIARLLTKDIRSKLRF